MQLCLFGAAPDTSNLGVTALGHSVIAGMLMRVRDAKLTVFDHTRGGIRSDDALQTLTGRSFDRFGAMNSKRFYWPESFKQIGFSAKFGGMLNHGAKRILGADAILDISGGDSFTDLYGQRRFDRVAISKLLAIKHDIPLILLPQTYGPFEKADNKRIAGEIVRHAAIAWARDERSLQVLHDIAGPDADTSRFKSGVDVAFALPPQKPDHPFVADQMPSFFDDGKPVVGFNVSGLIYNDPNAAREQYKFKADYRAVVEQFLRKILTETDASVLLIPHVLAEFGHYESDPEACDAICKLLAEDFADRVQVVPPDFECGEMKWIISQTDWFCGTRMHSTIAGLSTGVPTAAIAYSPKTLGVFETCSQGDSVADPRANDTQETIDQLWTAWANRETARQTLQEKLPAVLTQAERQMDDIVSLIDPSFSGTVAETVERLDSSNERELKTAS